jgi:CRISPR-associated protein (TIGR02584 family)
MSRIYLATLGERPSAITVALAKLQEQFSYEMIVILHTSIVAAQAPRLETGYHQLSEYLSNHVALPVHYHEITHGDGSPIIDTDNQRSAQDYYRGMIKALWRYKQQQYDLHLMVAGGRKAMTVYATLAAGTFFQNPYDRVWTVTSPNEMVKNVETFTIPPGKLDQVRLLEFPIMPSRLAPGVSPEFMLEHNHISLREQFIGKLKPRELEVAQALMENQYASNEELGRILKKSHKTIGNQLSSIYDAMKQFYAMPETTSPQVIRQRLIEIMRDHH